MSPERRRSALRRPLPPPPVPHLPPAVDAAGAGPRTVFARAGPAYRLCPCRAGPDAPGPPLPSLPFPRPRDRPSESVRAGQVFNRDGTVARTLGAEDGPGRLKTPFAVAVDRAGRVVVADSGNHRVLVRR